LLKKYKIVRTRIYGNAHPLGGWLSKTDGVVKGFFFFFSKKIFFNAPEGQNGGRIKYFKHEQYAVRYAIFNAMNF
jgi:hypothetical protein